VVLIRFLPTLCPNAAFRSKAFSKGVLTVTAIPEPATYSLLGASALTVAAVVRRRRVRGKTV